MNERRLVATKGMSQPTSIDGISNGEVNDIAQCYYQGQILDYSGKVTRIRALKDQSEGLCSRRSRLGEALANFSIFHIACRCNITSVVVKWTEGSQ